MNRRIGALLAATLLVCQSSSRFKTVVPILSTLVPDVSSPGTTSGAVELGHGDPSDAGGVVVVRNSNVACSATGNGLIYSLGADTAGVDVAAVGLTSVAVALIEGVDVAD